VDQAQNKMCTNFRSKEKSSLVSIRSWNVTYMYKI